MVGFGLVSVEFNFINKKFEILLTKTIEFCEFVVTNTTKFSVKF